MRDADITLKVYFSRANFQVSDKVSYLAAWLKGAEHLQLQLGMNSRSPKIQLLFEVSSMNT